MRGVRIPQDLNGDDQFVLGLSVSRLAALLLGLLAAYTIYHLSLPAPVQPLTATIAALPGAAIAWIRPEGGSLIHWALAAIEFKLGERSQPDSTQAPLAADPPASAIDSRIVARPPRLSIVDGRSRETASLPPPPAEPAAINGADMIELPDTADTAAPDLDREAGAPAPVYLGGPQVITFFSTKGGTGRTTLATEVAALLALKGRYRESPTGPRQPLRVALVDFDLASANVSARLGIAQPTMLDFLCDLTVAHPDPRDYIIQHHATGLHALLGPSKCLAGDRSEIFGVAQAAHILSALK